MPKITCPVCEGTLDANHDLPADEYVHYPCQSCKNGIKNYCDECDGKGHYWERRGYGDCGIMEYCYPCGATGFIRDYVELEVECRRCKDDLPKRKTDNGWDADFFESFGIEINLVCAKCNGTKRIKEKFYEGSKEYEDEKKADAEQQTEKKITH